MKLKAKRVGDKEHKINDKWSKYEMYLLGRYGGEQKRAQELKQQS